MESVRQGGRLREVAAVTARRLKPPIPSDLEYKGKQKLSNNNPSQAAALQKSFTVRECIPTDLTDRAAKFQ